MSNFREALIELEETYTIVIEWHKEVTSTNDLAKRGIYSHGDIVLAESQTAGRGQRGNRWSSSEGDNLTFSIVLKPNHVVAESQFYISKAIALAIVKTLAAFDIRATIKWPNDIYVGDRKICGTLIENDLMGTNLTKSVAGIGINVNQREFDPALLNPVSMRVVSKRGYNRAQVLEQFLKAVFPLFNLVDNGEFGAIDEEYFANLYRRNGVYRFAEPGGVPFDASIEQVLPSGALVLRKSDGTTKQYLFKEVAFVL